MNQILYVEKSKDKQSMNIETTAKISVVVILVFAMIIIGKGVFGIASNVRTSGLTEPKVSIREKEENKDILELKVTHDKAIDKIIYSWNDEAETTLLGKGRSEVIEEIESPVGNNVLKLKIIDIEKKETTYTKSYYKADDIDTDKPQIEFTSEGAKAKVTIKDNKELIKAYYHWNDEDDTDIPIREDSKTITEERIPLLVGKNKLVVTAIDSSNNEQIATKDYAYGKEPQIEFIQQGEEVYVIVTDEYEIKKMEITFNGEFSSTDPDNTGASLNMKQAGAKKTLQPGENTIIVKAYNIYDIAKEMTETFTLE